LEIDPADFHIPTVTTTTTRSINLVKTGPLWDTQSEGKVNHLFKTKLISRDPLHWCATPAALFACSVQIFTIAVAPKAVLYLRPELWRAAFLKNCSGRKLRLVNMPPYATIPSFSVWRRYRG
jgi:hypothetical protein